ncbi:HNH endonuclease signature motif containing protein [Lactococcus lactis]|uniref:HNH endonuclease n=1 Tax=Lactococcus lactis TaxID=1358 RepID=UPI003D286CDA
MKKVKEFRDYIITRTCTEQYSHYRSYKTALREDFKHRCAYCNLLDEIVTTYFEIDHFIPKKTCEEIGRGDLIVNYDNLVYSCKKCNLAKTNKYESSGLDDDIKNNRFYEPVETPLQEIFYRNIWGGIDSYDSKGRRMIIDLKLYRISHNLEWIIEVLQNICEKLERKISEQDVKGIDTTDLMCAYYLISTEYHKLHKVFISNYNTM